MANKEVELLPLQHQAINYLNDLSINTVLFGGAAGGGKSYLGSIWLITNCLTYPGTRWLIGRKRLNDLKGSTLKSFFDAAKMLGIYKRIYYDINWQNYTISFKNGSEIILKELCDQPNDPEFDRIGGFEITGAFIDEAAQISPKAFNVVKSRIRYKLDENNLTPKILLTCNPTKGWIYDQIYQKNKKNELPENVKFIQALPNSNQFLSRSYIQILQEMDKISYERLYLGNWEYEKNPLGMIEYEKILNFLDNNNSDENEEKYMSIDPAYIGGDRTIVAIWRGNTIIDIKERKGLENKINSQIELIKHLKEKYDIKEENIIIDVAGGYGNPISEEFPKAIRFNGANKPINEDLYSNARNEILYEFAKKINKNEYAINMEDDYEREAIIKELESLQRDKVDQDGKLFVIPKKEQKKYLNGNSPDYLEAISLRTFFDIKKIEKKNKFMIAAF